MNSDTASGKFDQLKGKAKQSVGEAIGNQRLANSGTVDQVKGNAKEAWGNAKDAVHAVSHDVQARASEKRAASRQNTANTAHDMREKTVSTAQNVKDAVRAKAEALRREHTHTP